MSIVRARGSASRRYDRPELEDIGALMPNKPKPKKKRRRRKRRRRDRTVYDDLWFEFAAIVR